MNKHHQDTVAACIGKEAFSSPRTAREVAQRMNRQKGSARLNTYLCAHCSQYHVGNKSEH